MLTHPRPASQEGRRRTLSWTSFPLCPCTPFLSSPRGLPGAAQSIEDQPGRDPAPQKVLEANAPTGQAGGVRRLPPEAREGQAWNGSTWAQTATSPTAPALVRQVRVNALSPGRRDAQRHQATTHRNTRTAKESDRHPSAAAARPFPQGPAPCHHSRGVSHLRGPHAVLQPRRSELRATSADTGESFQGRSPLARPGPPGQHQEQWRRLGEHTHTCARAVSAAPHGLCLTGSVWGSSGLRRPFQGLLQVPSGVFKCSLETDPGCFHCQSFKANRAALTSL